MIFFGSLTSVLDNSVKQCFYFRRVLKSLIDGPADCLEQFALFLIKQKNKIEIIKKSYKKRFANYEFLVVPMSLN